VIAPAPRHRLTAADAPAPITFIVSRRPSHSSSPPTRAFSHIAPVPFIRPKRCVRHRLLSTLSARLRTSSPDEHSCSGFPLNAPSTPPEATFICMWRQYQVSAPSRPGPDPGRGDWIMSNSAGMAAAHTCTDAIARGVNITLNTQQRRSWPAPVVRSVFRGRAVHLRCQRQFRCCTWAARVFSASPAKSAFAATSPARRPGHSRGGCGWLPTVSFNATLFPGYPRITPHCRRSASMLTTVAQIF